MNIECIRSFLLYCTVINYSILLIWFLFFVFGKDLLHRLHGRWFRLSDQQFDLIHYAAMATFKIGILLFNLAPLAALWLIR